MGVPALDHANADAKSGVAMTHPYIQEADALDALQAYRSFFFKSAGPSDYLAHNAQMPTAGHTSEPSEDQSGD